MKTLIILLLTAAVSAPCLAKGGGSAGKSSGSGGSTHSVRGYTTKDGTYVPPHRATNPNETRTDNWSTKGNVNPDTGKAGTKDLARGK